jgi:hypothetical protein
MKLIQNITVLVGLSAVLFVMGATGARGQIAYPARFAGTFTLSFEAQWGEMTLPAGDYTLQYGIQDNGRGLVVVRGTAKGSPYGMILAGPLGQTSVTKNAIVCIREGKKAYVRGLELPAIGATVHFALPHGVSVKAWIVSEKQRHSTNTQLAQAPMLIQRVPVKANGK